MSARRPRVLPQGMTLAAWLTLQDEFDRRLRRHGFKDIEGGRDLNALDASTFRGGGASDTNHGGHLSWDDAVRDRGHAPRDIGMSVGDESWAEQQQARAGAPRGTLLADHPTARFWAQLGQLAQALPRRRRHRRFLVLATEMGSVHGAAVKCGFPARSWRAYRIWRQFLFDHGLAESPYVPRPAARPYRANGRPD